MKSCQNCQSSFQVTDKDRVFLEKVSPCYNGKIYTFDEPKKCWQCKLQQRLSFRNERRLYKRTCDFSGKDIVSIYSPDKPYTVYHQDIWWSDQWDALDYGRDFDFSRPFFEQFNELLMEAPLMSVWLINEQNSQYNNSAYELKDCYMSFNSDVSERLFYGYGSDHCTDVMDASFIKQSELVYECLDGENLYNCYFSQQLSHCSDVYFSYNLSNCKNCFGCENLRNKAYYFFNQPLKKEEWEAKMTAFTFTPSSIQETLDKLRERRKELPERATTIVNCENVTGDHLYHSKNLENCFDVRKSEDCKHVFYAPWDLKNAMDCYAVALQSNAYEMMGGGVNCHKNAFVINFINGISSVYYSLYAVNGTSDCFGTVGLKRGQYCILNKQYTKEAYEKMIPKIIQHMQKTGEWGQYFPTSMSMFGYNESKAQELFPLKREEALARGFKWSDHQAPKPRSEKVIAASQIPESIDQIPDNILNWAIECEASGELFKITALELEMYRKMKLPIPRKSPNVRHRNRMVQRNSINLLKRSCFKCGGEIQTTHSPNVAEVVYCEGCYLEAVY